MACMSKPSRQMGKEPQDRATAAHLLPLELVHMDGDVDVSDAELEALELLLGADLHQLLQ